MRPMLYGFPSPRVVLTWSTDLACFQILASNFIYKLLTFSFFLNCHSSSKKTFLFLSFLYIHIVLPILVKYFLSSGTFFYRNHRESSLAKERTKAWKPSELQGTRFVNHWLTVCRVRSTIVLWLSFRGTYLCYAPYLSLLCFLWKQVNIIPGWLAWKWQSVTSALHIPMRPGARSFTELQEVLN